MARLERNSPAGFRTAVAGRMRHGPCELLHRHCHRESFVTLVLGGRYTEAGDTGCHRVSPGDVIWHRAYESHLDKFELRGADVWVIDLPENWSGPLLGSVANPDEIIRAGERDPIEALEILTSNFAPRNSSHEDWPELLATDLRANPSLNLTHWASTNGLHAGSLSRGFGQVFAVTPSEYRATQRARHALDAIIGTDLPLSEVAATCEFADQAHMSRAIKTLTGSAPAAMRRIYR